MPTLTIDNQEIKVDEGTTIIQACEKLDVYVPRYCYHPGVSIAGSCRMCMVEIENAPKLAIACHTRVSEGMNVTTTSEKVRHGRQSMLEFLLHNHPLDCPVCDQSGECDLQNFYMEHGQYDSRFLENKIKKRKAFPIGPHVMLDQERCILCTRCTRFSSEVSKSHELGVFNRGNRSVIDLNPGKSLDNPYSGNVIDICPVGALTEREFRFQCRVWYLSSQESICPGCSRGCNINVHFNERRRYKSGGRRIQRLKPRFNADVNEWWMCDEGRFGFEFVDQKRIEYPAAGNNGIREFSEWDEIYPRISRMIETTLESKGPSGIGVIASPQMSNEDLFAVRKLFQDQLGISQIGFRNPWEPEGSSDDLLMRGDKNPNSHGAAQILPSGDVREVLEKGASGDIEVLFIFHHDFSHDEARTLLEQTQQVIFQGSNENATSEMAHIVLPSATFAEKTGTFTNFEGRVQRFRQAFSPIGESKTDGEILIELASRLSKPIGESPDGLFEEWAGRSMADLSAEGEFLTAASDQGRAQPDNR